MTVGTMLATMTSSEMTEWLAYDQVKLEASKPKVADKIRRFFGR